MMNHWVGPVRAAGLPGLLFLHLSVRSCHASQVAGSERLTVAVDYLRVTLATAGQLHELELERMAAPPR